MFIFTLLFLLTYVVLIKNEQDKNILFLIFLYLSPPVNFAIFQGNPDIFFFVTLFLVNTFKGRLKIIFSMILGLFFFLYKLHPFGYMLGLMFYLLYNKSTKAFILQSTITIFQYW